MSHYALQAEEVVLYHGAITAVTAQKKEQAELRLTNLHLILDVKVKKLFREQTSEQVCSLEEIKIYQGKPQIRQKEEQVEVQLVSGDKILQFADKKEARRFIETALELLTGKRKAIRGAEKVRGAIDVVDTALGIDTVQTVKEVLESKLDIVGMVSKKVKGVKGKK